MRANFRPKRADFRSERAWGGGADGWTNESPPVFYRTSSPSGPLPCLSFQFTTMQSRATGIADHILPLGDLFRLERADFRLERSDFRLERATIRSERALRANSRLERA